MDHAREHDIWIDIQPQKHLIDAVASLIVIMGKLFCESKSIHKYMMGTVYITVSIRYRNMSNTVVPCTKHASSNRYGMVLVIPYDVKILM